MEEETMEVVTTWNHYIISHLRYDGPSGRPVIMFFIPHAVGTVDHLQYVTDNDVDEFQVVTG